MSVIRWTSDKFVELVADDLAKRMTKAGILYVSKTRGFLNVSQPYLRSGKRWRGLDPSSPGVYPKKLSGQLQRSITWNVKKSKSEVTLTVGSNTKGYPSYLQTGTRWMSPRPWLSLSFNQLGDEMGKIILGD